MDITGDTYLSMQRLFLTPLAVASLVLGCGQSPTTATSSDSMEFEQNSQALRSSARDESEERRHDPEPEADDTTAMEPEDDAFDDTAKHSSNSASSSRHHRPPTEEELSTPWPARNRRALARREKRVKAIYENLVYPTPISILTGETSMSDIFEETVVKGRVTPVGQFPGYSAVIEYFYALAVTPGSVVQAVKFNSLFAGDDKVAVEVDIFFCRAPYENCDPEVPVSENSQTLTQVGFFQFNRFDRVVSIDLNILNLGAASDVPDVPEVHAAAIGQLCTALTQAHIDPTTGDVVYSGTCTSSFDSEDDFEPGFPLSAEPFENCVAFMQSIPYGSWDRANSNTVVCRQLHSLLTPVDPHHHCPHTSPDGGGACIDMSYGSYYEEDF